MRLFLGYLFALLVVPLGAAIGVFGLAKVTGRLTRWRRVDDHGLMFDIREGTGFAWYFVSVAVRALTAFGASRLVFALARVRPSTLFAIAIVLILLGWDLWRFRLVSKAPIPIPTEIRSGEKARILIGLVASTLAALLFLSTP